MYSSYRKSAVNNTVRMFHFWDEMGKLTLVAAMFNFSEIKIDNAQLNRLASERSGEASPS
jgi:hypothetical protein